MYRPRSSSWIRLAMPVAMRMQNMMMWAMNVAAAPLTDDVDSTHAGATTVRDDDADEFRRCQHGLRAG